VSAPGARRTSVLLDSPPCTRTAERSLCITLTPPDGRVCNLDCTYCPFPRAEHRGSWPSPGTLEALLRNEVRNRPEVDSITVSGPGEPTLHPRFGQALAAVLSARQVRPRLPVRIVTNSVRVLDPRVRRLIAFADERVVRLDAAGERIEGKEPPLEVLRAALSELASFSLESVFVEGRDGNAGDDEVDAWVGRVVALAPLRVYVTTAVEPGYAGLRRASPERLEGIAGALRARCPAEVRVVP